MLDRPNPFAVSWQIVATKTVAPSSGSDVRRATVPARRHSLPAHQVASPAGTVVACVAAYIDAKGTVGIRVVHVPSKAASRKDDIVLQMFSHDLAIQYCHPG